MRAPQSVFTLCLSGTNSNWQFRSPNNLGLRGCKVSEASGRQSGKFQSFRKESWAWTGLWLLGLGTLGAAFSVATGLYGAEGVMIDPSVKQHLLVYHKRIMLGVLALALVLSIWALAARPMPLKGRRLFLILLLLLAGALTLGADFGGRMVYDYNAGGSARSQPIPYQGQ
jgi:uncharacterized membrane protein